MDNDYRDILAQIAPFKEKIFYLPLTRQELIDLEHDIGQHFPAYFQQFLLTFGIRQDLVFELTGRESDFVSSFNYLPAEYKQSFIPIADNGGEDTWLLSITNPGDKMLYEWQHWLYGEIKPLGFTFDELIQKNIQYIRDNFDSKPFNREKKWCVQFPVSTNNEALLLQTINAERIKDWEKTDVSPAEVHCYETEIRLGSEKIKLSRQEYKDWNYPMYYFDWQEPLIKIAGESTIKRLDEKLKKVFPNYGIIDYGILVL